MGRENTLGKTLAIAWSFIPLAIHFSRWGDRGARGKIMYQIQRAS